MDGTTRRERGLEPRDSLSLAVMKRVADHEGVEPTELDPPLCEAIDLDALNSLFGPSTAGARSPTGYVVFSYDDYEIRVSSDRRVRIFDSDGV